MKPILYNGNETDFTGNGIAVLAEALSCEVREVRNGEFELTLEYPVDGPWFKEIIEQRIVRAKPNDKDDLHNFRIYNVNKASSGETVVAQAATLSNDLGGNLVKHLKVNNATAQSALNAMKLNLVEATKYNFVSDISTLASTIWEMRNPLNCIVGEEGSLVDIWGGEVKRTDTTIYLYSRRGLDKVTRIRPRKGMTGFSMKTSVASVVTRVQPYAVYRDEKTEREVTVIGTIVESPRKGNYAFSRILPVQYTENADGTPITTTAQLNALAKNYFTENPNIDKPKVEINADLIALADTTFYDKFKKLETIGLTDTIEVYVPKYDIDVELKITELVYNVLTEQVISLKAGDTSSTFYQSNKYEYGYEVNQLKKYIYTVENGLRNYVQISADGKNTIFRGYTEPDKSISHEGDLWFKEVGNGEQEIWIFDGSYWQPLMTAGINEETAAQLALAQQALDKAKEDLKAVEEAMVTVDAAIADLEVEMKATKIATADAKKAASDAQISADDASAVGKAAKEAGDQALSLVDQAQKDIDSANATIGAHTIDLSKLFSDFASMDTVVDTIVIDTGTMKTAISENAADILTAQQLAESAKSKADAVEATTHTITQDLTTVTETITTIEETATSTTKTLNEVKSTVDGQVQTIATVKSTADSALSKSNTNSTTIDGIQTTLTSTKTTADSALSKANLAKSTADGNTTMISSVSSTANSALTKANTAQSTADGNTTTITSVQNELSNLDITDQNLYAQTSDEFKNITINGWNYYPMGSAYRIPVTEGVTYTGSVYLDNVVTTGVGVGLRLFWYNANNMLIRESPTTSDFIPNGSKGFYTETDTAPAGAVSVAVGIRNSDPVNTTVSYKELKFQKGNRATPWTPAFVDLASTTKVNQISDTVDGHTQLIASTKTTADSALSKANSAQSTADGNTTKITSVTTTANSALSKANTVSETVDGITRTISSLTVSGRNLLKDTDTLASRANGATPLDGTYNGNAVIKGEVTTGDYIDTYRQKTIEIPRDGDFALTFFAKGSKAGLAISNYFYSSGITTSAENSQGNVTTNSDGGNRLTLTTEWKQYWVKYSSKSATSTKEVLIGRLFGEGIVWISSPMLVEGTIPADWQNAPVDLARVTKVNQISDTVDGHTQLIASTKTTADSALTKANTAQSTADGNSTKISSVTTTADSALAKATSVETTANGLTSKVATVETTLANSGNPNLLPYGGGNPKVIHGWSAVAGLGLATHVFYKTGMSNLYVLTNPNTSERTASSDRFTVKPDTQYTFKFTGFASSNVVNMDVWWLSRSKGSTANYDRTKALITARRLSPSRAEEVSVTFTTDAADSEGYIRIDNNGSTNGSDAALFFIDVMMVEGPIAPKEWSPSYIELATASQFTQLSDQIDLRVEKAGVISAINVSTEGVIIAGNKITITGVTKIDNAVIKTAHIADANISTAKIADLAVSNGKIANLAVTEGKIGNLAVTNAKIGNLAVDSGKIADASIITAKIGDLAVSEAKIANLAVTNAKIANLAVTGAKIANATIVTANIQDAAITDAKIGSLSATKITTGTLNASNVNVINLNASNITSGTISGANLSINLATGSVLFSKGKIANIDNTFYIDIDNDTYYSEGYTSASLANKAVTVLRGGTVRTAIKQANVSERIEGVQIIGNGAIRSYVPKDASSSLSLTDEIYNSNYQMVTDLKVNHNTSGSTRYGNFGVELYKVASGGTPSLTDMPYLQMNGVNSTFKVYAVKKIDLVTNETLTLSAKRTDINGGGDSTTYGGITFGRDGSSARVWSMSIYNRTYSNAANMFITTAGTIGRSTSARKYKADIQVADEVISKANLLYTINPASWFDKAELRANGSSNRYYGYIADEFDELGLKEVVIYGKNGEVESLAYDRLSIYMIPLIQSLKNEVDQLKNKVKELEAA